MILCTLTGGGVILQVKSWRTVTGKSSECVDAVVATVVCS